MRIAVAHLYPDYLNIYADRGNIAVLARRAALRGHSLEVTGVERLVLTGDRAAELALRCTYGGLAESAIEVVPGLETGLDRCLELVPAGGELTVLPTYTAMLALRRILASRGHVPQYWEQAA